VNILNGKVNLDEYYVFIDFDYVKFTPKVKELYTTEKDGDKAKAWKKFTKLIKDL